MTTENTRPEHALEDERHQGEEPRGPLTRLGADGIVRRGENTRLLRAAEALAPGEALRCCVGVPKGEALCEEPSVMEVYGIPMCEAHGEEAAEGALEEIYHDARQDLMRTLNPFLEPLNPEAVRALEAAENRLDKVRPELDVYEVLARAYPLDAAARSRVDAETVAQIENPEAYRGYEHSSDMFLGHRHLICRLMRRAYEQGAQYIVEALEPLRLEAAQQAAYAHALEEEHRDRGER